MLRHRRRFHRCEAAVRAAYHRGGYGCPDRSRCVRIPISRGVHHRPCATLTVLLCDSATANLRPSRPCDFPLQERLVCGGDTQCLWVSPHAHHPCVVTTCPQVYKLSCWLSLRASGRATSAMAGTRCMQEKHLGYLTCIVLQVLHTGIGMSSSSLSLHPCWATLQQRTRAWVR